MEWRQTPNAWKNGKAKEIDDKRHARWAAPRKAVPTNWKQNCEETCRKQHVRNETQNVRKLKKTKSVPRSCDHKPCSKLPQRMLMQKLIQHAKEFQPKTNQRILDDEGRSNDILQAANLIHYAEFNVKQRITKAYTPAKQQQTQQQKRLENRHTDTRQTARTPA